MKPHSKTIGDFFKRGELGDESIKRYQDYVTGQDCSHAQMMLLDESGKATWINSWMDNQMEQVVEVKLSKETEKAVYAFMAEESTECISWLTDWVYGIRKATNRIFNGETTCLAALQVYDEFEQCTFYRDNSSSFVMDLRQFKNKRFTQCAMFNIQKTEGGITHIQGTNIKWHDCFFAVTNDPSRKRYLNDYTMHLVEPATPDESQQLKIPPFRADWPSNIKWHEDNIGPVQKVYNYTITKVQDALERKVEGAAFREVCGIKIYETPESERSEP